jgi:catechol 2,3-dioxygenase-like lactoylglutathione lyase family enzyme
MLGTSNVVAFVATSRPAEARIFYEDVLGLRFVSDEPFALVFDANGTELRVTKVERSTPQSFTVLGWSVPDVRAAVQGLKAPGVQFERYEGMGQDDDGVWQSPGGAKVAWFKDPDGNLLSLSGL